MASEQPRGERAERTVTLSRAEAVAHALRSHISAGTLAPGDRLVEAELTQEHGVSRNTLREAFRLLSQEGLVTHIPNRGALVATPSITSIIDLYRVRRMIECQAIRGSLPKHPAITAMRRAVTMAVKGRDENDWTRVGTANIAFHAAIIELADSPRLRQLFDNYTAELRLAFGLIDDPEYLHAPFIDQNLAIVELIEAGKTAEAADLLDDYLVRAERILLAAYERLSETSPSGNPSSGS
ncbi:GntR family transcriptional regulator [Leucobacter chinensis]|uniref:GntR family transcriptional regulator n=1 Tax=Leucobacter chinensis TaxID=2851010 RepID=UPI001C22837B|nr:GntR family transcriptional regulator [Leucobacter chinensis]